MKNESNVVMVWNLLLSLMCVLLLWLYMYVDNNSTSMHSEFAQNIERLNDRISQLEYANTICDTVYVKFSPGIVVCSENQADKSHQAQTQRKLSAANTNQKTK